MSDDFNPNQEDTDQDGLGDVCDADDDGDGLRVLVDALPLVPMDCSGAQCQNNVFSDLANGGVSEGEFRSVDSGLTVTVLDEMPNPDEGVRVIGTGATGGERARLKLPSGGFVVDGVSQSGVNYSFTSPANFVLTKTNSALLEVEEGTVEAESEELGIAVAVESGQSIEIEETSFTEVVVTSIEGAPILTVAESGATITFEEEGSLKSRKSPLQIHSC